MSFKLVISVAYLCNSKEYGLSDYFAICSFKKHEILAIQFHTGNLDMGNNTTHKIGSSSKQRNSSLFSKSLPTFLTITHLKKY